MASKTRIERLNSLLKEVISEVVMRDVRNPKVAALITITRVDISNDLHHAKVFVSVIGDEKQKEETIAALQSGAGFIACTASKKVVMRYFPALVFKLDSSVDQHMRIETMLSQIHQEQAARKHTSQDE
jgi:ribosome-binding factor A